MAVELLPLAKTSYLSMWNPLLDYPKFLLFANQIQSSILVIIMLMFHFLSLNINKICQRIFNILRWFYLNIFPYDFFFLWRIFYSLIKITLTTLHQIWNLPPAYGILSQIIRESLFVCVRKNNILMYLLRIYIILYFYDFILFYF